MINEQEVCKVVMHNKNTPVLALDMIGNEVISINKVINSKLLPLCFRHVIGVKSLNSWISKRLINSTREHYEDVIKEFPYFENYGCMFSLSDQYWFQKRDDQNWEDLNFFTNDYNDDVGKMFFSPWDIDPRHSGFTSPDLTTNGVLMKAWRKENGIDYLYKTKSSSNQQQPINEVLASIFLDQLKFLPFVDYELDIYGLKLCSKCQGFVTKDTEFVPAMYVYNLSEKREEVSHYDHFLEMCKQEGIEGAKDFMDKMIASDLLIGNDDRHFGNFGFIRDVESGIITGFAPLFDSGSSFYGSNKKGDKGKSKFFAAEMENALINVVKKYDLSNVKYDQMISLLEKYPELAWKEKMVIKDNIEATAEYLQQIIKKVR